MLEIKCTDNLIKSRSKAKQVTKVQPKSIYKAILKAKMANIHRSSPEVPRSHKIYANGYQSIFQLVFKAASLPLRQLELRKKKIKTHIYQTTYADKMDRPERGIFKTHFPDKST